MTTEELLVLIGKKIKSVRDSKGISQQDLAAKCNFEKSNMSRIEAGNTNLTVRTLLKISQALSVDISELLDTKN